MKRTKQEALLTKELIMDAALDVFLKKGYSGSTTEDIINNTKLTRGAFYWHFKDKVDLFNQVISREFEYISNLIVDSFVSHNDEKTEFQNLLLRVLDNFYNNSRFRKVIYLTWFRVEVDLNCNVMRDKTTFNEFFIEEVQKLLTSAQKKGLLPPSINPLHEAVNITCLITGFYRLYFVTPAYLRNPHIPVQIVRQYVERLFLPSKSSNANNVVEEPISIWQN